MTDFTRRYTNLNAAQKQAVDQLDGPVMVVAGPGTGKTELLSVRVANILQTTDELPGNILCLTFTESGASAMRERLAGLIGADAYKVAIHTFHSFGSEIINQYGEYFYNGAQFRPADELSSYETLYDIFSKIPHDSPLASKMNDDYTYLRSAQKSISDLKKSGLTPDELLQICDRNDALVDWLQPELQAAIGDRISNKSLPSIDTLLAQLEDYTEEPLQLLNYQPLYRLVADSLRRALDTCLADGKTTALTVWKREWCEKNAGGELTLKDAKRSIKLRAVSGVYYAYLVAMQARQLYDFDDMILRVVHGVEVFSELRLNLQEQFHYIMIDEFQDTNDAQMRLVWNLTNAAVNEEHPNLMVVGDDDQAIYRFQGANISNILDFRTLYRDVELVTLTDNYRSSAPILDISRQVIVQGTERLESIIPELDKQLTAHRPPVESPVSLVNYANELHEYSQIASRLARRDTAQSHAVIARNHRQLRALLPYLQTAGLPIRYAAQENILDNPVVIHLELIARIVCQVAQNQLHEANTLIPQLLAHPAWGIDTTLVWRLSVRAHSERKQWLELMLLDDSPQIRQIATWILTNARDAHHQPLEYMIDSLTGSIADTITDNDMSESYAIDSTTDKEFVSPLKAYYFDSTSLETNAMEYAQFLSALRTLRQHIREYRPDQTLDIKDFIEFIDLHRRLQLPIEASNSYGIADDAIELLTAHRAKGLEFDDVTVISLTDNVWGETVRSPPQPLKFPHNLPLDAALDTTDEKLRLLYVAMTRAKQQLHLTSHTTLDGGKATPLVGYLVSDSIHVTSAATPTITQQIKSELVDWRTPLIHNTSGTYTDVLRPLLERYKLSATHLNNFLDVTRGGPETFLLHNLLRFPSAMSPHATYGSAIHSTLQRAHQHLRATGDRRPVEDILGDFETALREGYLSERDLDHFLTRGVDSLNAFLAQRYDSFTGAQIAERNFAGQGVRIGDATITGAIDLIEVNEADRTIIVTDYKTGRASSSWRGKTEPEKIKLHHYRQQLIFYKLLLENSREYTGYTVTTGRLLYVEPAPNGQIVSLDLLFDGDAETSELTPLVQAVWSRIMSLDFTTPGARASLGDIRAFEHELLA